MTTGDESEPAPRHVGLDLPPREALAAFAWCDARAEALLRRLSGDRETPFVLQREDQREYVDMDRGQEWPAGDRTKNYRLGALEARPHYSWARDGGFRESFSLTILRHDGDRVASLTGLYLRVSHVSIPSGPESWCAVRYQGAGDDLQALVRFFREEAARAPVAAPLASGGNKL